MKPVANGVASIMKLRAELPVRPWAGARDCAAAWGQALEAAFWGHDARIGIALTNDT